MKKYCTINKNKAFIFLQVIIISFLFISLTLFIQILLNSRFNLYKTDVKTQENFQDYDFLDEIIKQEFKNIEEKINNREIKDAIGYIVLSENGEKIFLINDYNKRISFGGYRLLEDQKGKNYYNYLKDKIKGMYKPRVNVHFIKNIKITDKNYSLFATVEYEIGSSREPDTLHNGILTRMWIKENV
ncbi:hypothetical protein ACDQ58_10475 [Fusobacterium animalis]|uniref:hypothetical protein n=1 Tax=Fusobacterium TaxID=848 RepID=UPI00033FE5E6|nr:hypothetical protein [Fusobacterium sp. CAG:649]CDA08889.1 putative uncharacterized protein [Fusobacterium sp. CAG:649]